jgi:DNA-binding transcriptional MerR regulator
MEDRSPSYRIGQLALRTGVRPERLRAWESRYGLLEPERSEGGFRIYSREDERRVQLMRRHLARGFAAAEAAELARNGIVSPSPVRIAPRIPPRVVERSLGLLRRAFEEFDESPGIQALDDLFRAYTVEAVLRDAIMPFLNEVGEAWDRGRATPGHEHFATALIHARLLSIAGNWGTGRGPTALLACPPGERHTLGLISFGIALSRCGWLIIYLGEDTPVSSIEQAARKVEPEVVVLAASNARRFEEPIEELRRLATNHPLELAGAGSSNALATRIGAECLGGDPVSAAAALAARKRQRRAEAGRV